MNFRKIITIAVCAIIGIFVWEHRDDINWGKVVAVGSVLGAIAFVILIGCGYYLITYGEV